MCNVNAFPGFRRLYGYFMRHQPHTISLLRFVLALVWCMVLLPELPAQESFFTTLYKQSSPRMFLYCDWDSVVQTKDNASRAARIRTHPKDTNSEWRAELTIRGRFRRMRCEFPPLEINLKKGELRKRGLQEFDKLKLVTHCNNSSPDATDLDEELLIYQLYALLTPYSYRATSLRVDYLFNNGKAYQRNKIGLLLEPTSELRHRLGLIEKEGFGIPADSLDGESYCRVALFQFMVGNFDWDQSQQRNIKMLGQPGRYHLVPYDFDFSAIVFPAYARMPGDLGLQDFRDRIYRGVYFNDLIPRVVAQFLSKKQTLVNHVMQYPHLTLDRRNEIISYLEGFFEYITSHAGEIKEGTILPYVKQ